MKSVKVTATTEYEFSYDPESESFKKTLHDFREICLKDADEEDVIKNAAHYLAANGGSCDGMAEGIGYIWRVGRTGNEPFSGIYVKTDSPEFDYEIE